MTSQRGRKKNTIHREKKPREKTRHERVKPEIAPPEPMTERAPRPPRSPMAAIPDAETTHHLETSEIVTTNPFDPTPTGVAYPMFPDHPAGSIDAVKVYRKLGKPDGEKGTDWEPIELPWVPTKVSKELIGEICGGGMYGVLARKNGRMVANAQFTLGGHPRAPNQRDIYKLSPGLNENGDIVETANGWVTIPGIDSSTQAAFVAFQQLAWGARKDQNNAVSSLFQICDTMVEILRRPDAGIEVLRQLCDTQRLQINKLYEDMNALKLENTNLKVSDASGGREMTKMKIALYQKGLDVIDGAAGAVAQKLLKAGEQGTHGTPQQLGSAIGTQINSLFTQSKAP